MEDAKSQPNQSRERNPTQKAKHREYCARYRQKIKRRREELELTEVEHNEILPEFKRIRTAFKGIEAENQEMKTKQNQLESKILELQNLNQQLNATIQAQNAKEAWMRQIPLQWKVNGQNFTSFEQVQEWCLSQTCMQDCHVSGLGAIEIDNFPPSMVDFSQKMGFDQLNGTGINLGASTSAGPTSGANHDVPFGSDASNSHGVWINPTAVEDNFPDLPVLNNVDNLFNVDDPDAGILPNYEAGPSSFRAYNLENDCDLFTHGPAPGF